MKKLTKKSIINKLKSISITPLQKRVLSNILNNVERYEGMFQEKLESCFKDYSHGCETGTVSELICYCDTEKWFNRYKKEIISMLESDIQEGLFEVKYVETEKEYFPVITVNKCDDYIKLVEHSNLVSQVKFSGDLKNILAWYSFEKICYELNWKFDEIQESN